LFKQDSCNSRNGDLEIDIYEKEDDVGGGKSARLQFNGNAYDLSTNFFNFSQSYMGQLCQLAG
jgi:hypothetical protein